MEQTENDNQEKYSEEYRKHVRLAARQQNESYEGGEASIEDSWTHLCDGRGRPLPPGAGQGEKGVTDVDRVVHAQTNGDDYIDGADDVNADVPGVHEPTQVHQAEGDCPEDEDGSQQVRQEDQSGQEDAGESEAEVSEQLPCYDLVSFPVGIFLELRPVRSDV